MPSPHTQPLYTPSTWRHDCPNLSHCVGVGVVLLPRVKKMQSASRRIDACFRTMLECSFHEGTSNRFGAWTCMCPHNQHGRCKDKSAKINAGECAKTAFSFCGAVIWKMRTFKSIAREITRRRSFLRSPRTTFGRARELTFDEGSNTS